MGLLSGTIIYDGECQYCIKQIHRIQNLDRKKQFLFDIRQNKNLYALYPELEPYDGIDGLRFVRADKEAFIGADAVHQIYKCISPFQLLTWTYHIPVLKQFFKLIYLIIAKNRYRLSKTCKDGVCDIPYKERSL